MKLSLIRKYYIYTLSHPDTNEVRYIGKTYDIKIRFSQHINSAKIDTKSKIKSWIRGLLNNNKMPKIDVIEETTESESSFWECHYISLYKSFNMKLLNMTNGGDTPPARKGKDHHIHKYGLTNKQKETLKRVGFKNGHIPQNKNKKHSQETKDKMSLAWLDKKMPSKWYKTKYSFNSENNPNRRIVLNLETGIYYNTLKSACISNNYNYGYMGLVMQGRIKNKSKLIYV